MRFADFFAGLGGFHLALTSLGHTCVFACEVDSALKELYETNFGIVPAGDIREVDEAAVPDHDILCAGFPCQPFSKAGDQTGFADEESGDLFQHLIRVLAVKNPTYIILENVANFEKHDQGRTWIYAKGKLKELGYEVQIRKLSPHHFGIPQIRERVIIVGSRLGLDHFEWPEPIQGTAVSVRTVLESSPSDARRLPQQVLECISAWQTFLDLYPPDEELPSFPIWSMEFGASYPFEDTTPYTMGPARLRKYLGTHGASLDLDDDDQIWAALPSYARRPDVKFPDWKIDFIRQNRRLYERNREWIDPWLPMIRPFPPSFQKFEWNCKGEVRDLNQHVLQTRASGVRVKRPTTAPSLVAMTSTQVPIITWEKRYMTPGECARLQSMDGIVLPSIPTRAYRALGNAVNVKVVESVARALLDVESGCDE